MFLESILELKYYHKLLYLNKILKLKKCLIEVTEDCVIYLEVYSHFDYIYSIEKPRDINIVLYK